MAEDIFNGRNKELELYTESNISKKIDMRKKILFLTIVAELLCFQKYALSSDFNSKITYKNILLKSDSVVKRIIHQFDGLENRPLKEQIIILDNDVAELKKIRAAAKKGIDSIKNTNKHFDDMKDLLKVMSDLLESYENFRDDLIAKRKLE